MTITQVGETVHLSAKVFHRTARASIDKHHRPDPFVIPAGLLQPVHEYRNSKCDRSTTNDSGSLHLPKVRRNVRLRFSTTDSTSTLIRNLTVSTPILTPPYSRSFSCKTQSNGPQPPRKPPLPPLRRSSTPSRIQAALALEEDEALSSIPTITNADLHRQSAVKREKDRKQQVRQDALDALWMASAKRLTNLSTQSARAMMHLKESIKVVRRDARRDYLEFKRGLIDRYRSILNAHSRRLAAIVSEIPESTAELDSALAKARRKAILHVRASRYIEERGYRELESKINTQSAELHKTHKDLADLMYTKHWHDWRDEKISMQTAEAVRAASALKAAGASHEQCKNDTKALVDAYTRLEHMLYKLDDSLMTESGQLVHEHQARHYCDILTIATEVEEVKSRLLAESHQWRKQDRARAISSRCPQLIDHFVIVMRAEAIITKLRAGTGNIGMLLARHKSSYLGKEPPQYQKRFSMYLLNSFHREGLATLCEQYMDFLTDGLVMSNPAMMFQLGRLKYAAMRPFTTYQITLRDTARTLRKNMEEIQHWRIKEKRSAILKSPARRQWSNKVYQLYDKAMGDHKATVRPLLDDITDVTYIWFARMAITGGNTYLETRLSREAENAHLLTTQEQALDDLSSLTEYRSTTYLEGLGDPHRLLGQRQLYPAGKKYPVDLIMQKPKIYQALRALSRETVLGFDIARNGAFVSFATLKRVAIFDWGEQRPRNSTMSGSGINQILLRQLLENPNITKVVHNLDSMRPYLSQQRIAIKNVVSLTRSESNDSNSKDVLPRVVSAGAWMPPDHVTGDETLISFLTSLAFLSAYNLWTFLQKIPPERLSAVESTVRSNIEKGQKSLRQQIASAREQTAIELGPLNVDAQGNFGYLLLRFHGRRMGVNSVFEFAQCMAMETIKGPSNSTRKRSREGPVMKAIKVEEQMGLVAYHMFTSMGMDVSSIAKMLRTDFVANDILFAAEEFNLLLHESDRTMLELAETQNVQQARRPSTTSSAPGIEELRTLGGRAMRRKRSRALCRSVLSTEGSPAIQRKDKSGPETETGIALESFTIFSTPSSTMQNEPGGTESKPRATSKAVRRQHGIKLRSKSATQPVTNIRPRKFLLSPVQQRTMSRRERRTASMKRAVSTTRARSVDSGASIHADKLSRRVELDATAPRVNDVESRRQGGTTSSRNVQDQQTDAKTGSTLFKPFRSIWNAFKIEKEGEEKPRT